MSKQYNATLQTYNAQLQALIDTANSLPEAGGSTNPIAKYNEVNFYDYDGTILYSYTVEEAQALTELPPLPTQPGLICQGWNYDLDTIKSYNRAVNVGATYITDDGKTRLYIRIAAEGRMIVPLYFSQTTANGVTIDWGDGSATETLSGTGNVSKQHTYSNIGDYIISLEVTSGTLGLGHCLAPYCVMGVTNEGREIYPNMLQKVEIGNSVTSIDDYAFNHCRSLESIVIPNSVASIGSNVFQYCRFLTSIVIPNGVTNIGVAAFYYCHSLSSIVIPDSVTSINNGAFWGCYSFASVVIPDGVINIGSNAFSYCHSFASIVIPNSVASIGSGAFFYCSEMAFYDFTSHTSVPTLADINVFDKNPLNCKIRVPTSLYNEWIVATNWSAYADNIVTADDDTGEGVVTIIVFTILNDETGSYQAEDGMTWVDWLYSKYNTGGYYNVQQGITKDNHLYIMDTVTGEYVTVTDVIIDNRRYAYT